MGDELPEVLVQAVRKYITELEAMTSKTFGSMDPEKFPMLLAIRARLAMMLIPFVLICHIPPTDTAERILSHNLHTAPPSPYPSWRPAW
jgi:hypothetical protein